MTDSEHEQQRKQLLDMRLKGEIDQAAYDQLLAEVERLRGDTEKGASAQETLGEVPTGGKLPAAQSSHDTLGGMPTGFGQAPLTEGYTLGSYRIESRLGRGGMGEVWKAFSPTEERHVVIKIVPRDIQYHSEEVDRLKASFKLIHSLQHQHICPVLSLAEDPRVGLYLIMAFVDGLTLSGYWRKLCPDYGPMELDEIARLLKPVAAALDYAHEHKVIHRDIKPPNIMVANDGSDVQVIDFGIAAQIQTSMTRVSRQQFDTSGTAPYMAPEQWRGQGLDGRSDQYALAMVAYELLAGRLPFESPDLQILRQCVIHEEPPVLADHSDHVNAAVQKALAKKREDRFENCGAFLGALSNPISEEIVDAEILDFPDRSEDVFAEEKQTYLESGTDQSQEAVATDNDTIQPTKRRASRPGTHKTRPTQGIPKKVKPPVTPVRPAVTGPTQSRSTGRQAKPNQKKENSGSGWGCLLVIIIVIAGIAGFDKLQRTYKAKQTAGQTVADMADATARLDAFKSKYVVPDDSGIAAIAEMSKRDTPNIKKQYDKYIAGWKREKDAALERERRAAEQASEPKETAKSDTQTVDMRDNRIISLNPMFPEYLGHTIPQFVNPYEEAEKLIRQLQSIMSRAEQNAGNVQAIQDIEKQYRETRDKLRSLVNDGTRVDFPPVWHVDSPQPLRDLVQPWIR